MNTEIKKYNAAYKGMDKKIANTLAECMDSELQETESKIWHGHPVWFIDENPIVGYSKQKAGWRLMFWSGADFEEKKLDVRGKKFKDASIVYNSPAEIDTKEIKRWIQKAKKIQWDYKNIVKRKGVLEKISPEKIKMQQHDARIANMLFGTVYPLYREKVEKKGRSKKELLEVIKWLTGFQEKDLKKLIDENATFHTFFQKATLHPNAHLITGLICGYRIEEIENELTKKVRYLDKLVDELARGKKMETILRESNL